MAKKSFCKVGYKAVKEEEDRREKARKENEGKLWRVFFPKDSDDDFEIPVVFLTSEPVTYREHSVMDGGKRVQRTCTGDSDCPYCADGDKPRFVGAYLVVDRSEYEKIDPKTKKKTIVKDKLRLLVRGTTDLANLERLEKKKGLEGKEWIIYKTGSDTTTKWNFDLEGKFKFSKKELENIIPEKFKGMDFMDIVIEQIEPVEEDYENEEDDEEDDEDYSANSGVVKMDDEEDEDEDEEDEDEEDEDEDRKSRRSRRTSSTSRKSKSTRESKRTGNSSSRAGRNPRRGRK